MLFIDKNLAIFSANSQNLILVSPAAVSTRLPSLIGKALRPLALQSVQILTP